jgi:hypothetical protein
MLQIKISRTNWRLLQAIAPRQETETSQLACCFSKRAPGSNHWMVRNFLRILTLKLINSLFIFVWLLMGRDNQMCSEQLAIQLPGCLTASVTNITRNSVLALLWMALRKKTPILRIAPENLLMPVPSQFSHSSWTTLKIEVASSSKTLVPTYQFTRSHVLRARNSQHCYGNVSSHVGCFPKTQLKGKIVSVQVMKAYKWKYSYTRS